jgi:hypothetical protein
MTVHVRQKQSAGGGILTDLWVDDFDLNLANTRANYLFHSTTNSTDFTPGVAGSNLSWAGGASTSSVMGWFPVAIGAVRGLEQFSEMTLVTATVSNRSGVAVLGCGDGRSSALGGFNQCYKLVNAAAIPGGNFIIQSMTGNTVLTTIGAGFAGAQLGDRIALGVRFLAAGVNELEVWFNGVSQGTRQDAVPTVARQGLPGLAGNNIVNGSVLAISRLRCGALTRLGY